MGVTCSTRGGEEKYCAYILIGKPEGIRKTRLTGGDRSRVWRRGTDSSGSGYGPVVCPCEHGAINGVEFLD
jgi:hypothetical protein